MPTEPNPQFLVGMLSKKQHEMVHNWVVQKWGSGNPNGLPRCSMCKSPEMSWSIGTHIVSPILFSNGAINIGGAVYPVVTVMCSNCGNTHYVNAIISGLLGLTPDKKIILDPEAKGASDA